MANEFTDEEIDQKHLRRQGEFRTSRKDLFAANAPAMPGWFMMEYLDRNAKRSRNDPDWNTKRSRNDPDGMAEAKANGLLLDAEVQWRWEFAEKMIRMERIRR